MNSKDTYNYIISELSELNPEICRLIVYLHPYYVINNLNDGKEDANVELSNRLSKNGEIAEYYNIYYQGRLKWEDFPDKRDYFIAEGKRVLDLILSKNENFKERYDNLIQKLDRFPKTKDYKTLVKVYDQFMIQLVYRCADEDISYWGDFKYTTNIYNFLVKKALTEIRQIKKGNKDSNNSKK